MKLKKNIDKLPAIVPSIDVVLKSRDPAMLALLVPFVEQSDHLFKAHTRDWMEIVFSSKKTKLMGSSYVFDINDFQRLLSTPLDLECFDIAFLKKLQRYVKETFRILEFTYLVDFLSKQIAGWENFWHYNRRIYVTFGFALEQPKSNFSSEEFVSLVNYFDQNILTLERSNFERLKLKADLNNRQDDFTVLCRKFILRRPDSSQFVDNSEAGSPSKRLKIN